MRVLNKVGFERTLTLKESLLIGMESLRLYGNMIQYRMNKFSFLLLEGALPRRRLGPWKTISCSWDWSMRHGAGRGGAASLLRTPKTQIFFLDTFSKEMTVSRGPIEGSTECHFQRVNG